MGIIDDLTSSSYFEESLARSSEDIPLKLNENLADRRRREKQRILAIALCIVSLILNLILCVAAFVFASLRRSPATFAFAADCVLDLISSLIVIWRYFGSPYTTCSHSREVKACISLGVLFILAGVGVIAQGVYFLCAKETPAWYLVLIILAGVGCVACILLGAAKFWLSKKMDSKPLFLDALNSILSALFALTIIVSDVAYLKNKEIWYLDPVLSIILSLGLLAFGIHTIIAHGRHEGYERSEN